MARKPFVTKVGDLPRVKSAQYSQIYTNNALVLRVGSDVHIMLGMPDPELTDGDVSSIRILDHHCLVLEAVLARKLATHILEVLQLNPGEEASPGPDDPAT